MFTNLFYRVQSKVRSLLRLGQAVIRGGSSKPLYPNSQSDGLKVHLGAGPINLQGWVNVDARADSHIHLQAEGFDLDEFTDGAISEIYMCHVLEHFSVAESELVLGKLHRKLKTGGVLRLSVPDFDKLVDVYLANSRRLGSVSQALLGGQDYEYNFHKSLYTPSFLKDLLGSCGFADPVEWTAKEDFGVDLEDWSEKKYITPKSVSHISLNLKARKA